MKQKRSLWKLLLTAAVIVVVLITVFTATGVFASLADTTKVVTVKEGSLGCEVGKDYVIRSTGTVPALLRARIVVNWIDEEGNILALAPEGATVTVSTASGWTQFPADARTAGEGCWYCNKLLEPGAQVSLIDRIDAEGGTVRVTVLAEVIQSEPKQAAKEAWGMSWTDGSWTKN